MRADLTQAEITALLDACLARMPRTRREIFFAIRFDSMGFGEVADRTGLSVRQVERHFSKAMRGLGRALDYPAPLRWWQRPFRRIGLHGSP